MDSANTRRVEDYTVGWVVALVCEFVAAVKMLDNEHNPLPQQDRSDNNVYHYGDIHGHNVVIVSLPLARHGNVSAQRTIQHLRRNFPNLQIHFFVGIGGGIPRGLAENGSQEDLRLGDVVISVPETNGVPAIIEYGHVRQYGDDYELSSQLDKPDPRVVQPLTHIKAARLLGTSKYAEHLRRATDTAEFKYPGLDQDILFPPDYKHQARKDHPCSGMCDPTKQIKRRRRTSQTPVIHQGTILSGDTIMKDASGRDELSRKHHNAICIETEAAGIMDDLHPLIIRGIADYADDHKNSSWQFYAAATAAALAREILYQIQPVRMAMGHESNGRAVSESNKSKLQIPRKPILTIDQRAEKIVDDAYTLLNQRGKEDLEAARQEFLRVLQPPTVLDSSLHLKVNWGLMVAEKELSCYKNFDIEEKLNHIKEAGRYCKAAAKAEERSPNASVRVHVKLEHYIIKGRRALLEFERGADTDKVCRLKRDVVMRLDQALGEMEVIDPDKFNKLQVSATAWRKRITQPPY